MGGGEGLECMVGRGGEGGIGAWSFSQNQPNVSVLPKCSCLFVNLIAKCLPKHFLGVEL